MKKATLILSNFLLAVMIILPASVSAQQNAKERKLADTPNISWDKSKHVFGSIPHKKPVTAKFEFTNKNKEAVAITKVGTTCGCTAPKYSKEPIKPGEKGSVELVFDAKNGGFFKKAAKIHFSNGQAKEVEIEGKVVVLKQNVRK